MPFSFLIFTVLVVVAVSAWYERKTKIVPAPTLPGVRKMILIALEKHLKKPDARIAELGSGWGGLLFAIARKFPASEIEGYELSPFPYWISKLRLKFLKHNITIRRDNFFKAGFGGFDVIVCYLSPHHMNELKPKFDIELKSGALIVSNAFPIPGWTPIETLQGGTLLKIPVFVYRKN